MCCCERVRPKKRPNLKAPETLDAVLSEVGEQRFSKSPLPLSRSTWKKVVGLNIAERTEPSQLDRGVLTIRCATSVWANELSLLNDQLIQRLKDEGVHVRELRFRVGAIVTLERPPERRASRKVPKPVPLTPDVKEALLVVEDEELRQALAAAAAQSLGWEAANQKARGPRVTVERRAAPALPGAETRSAPPGHTYRDADEEPQDTNEGD